MLVEIFRFILCCEVKAFFSKLVVEEPIAATAMHRARHEAHLTGQGQQLDGVHRSTTCIANLLVFHTILE
jgi:hypothetical protein